MYPKKFSLQYSQRISGDSRVNVERPLESSYSGLLSLTINDRVIIWCYPLNYRCFPLVTRMPHRQQQPLGLVLVLLLQIVLCPTELKLCELPEAQRLKPKET